MKIRLSLARTADAANIADMSRYLIEHGLEQSWTEARVRARVLDNAYAVLVAKRNRRLVGFAIMEFLDRHAHLALLAVHPSFRRQGIGRDMIEWLESSARVAGIFDIRLEMRAFNDEAKRFYQRLGYEIGGRRRAYYGGIEDALCLQRDLSVAPALKSRFFSL